MDSGSSLAEGLERQELIAVWASGSGSNAEALIRYFHEGDGIGVAKVDLVVTNRAGAGVIKKAQSLGVPVFVLPSQIEGAELLAWMQRCGITFIALAGYLKPVLKEVVNGYRGSIVNIHPALLPRHGGHGMYGIRVHEAVIEAEDLVSGMTVHYVTERYDEGPIIFQTQCEVEDNDEAEDLAARVLALEHAHYGPVIADLLRER